MGQEKKNNKRRNNKETQNIAESHGKAATLHSGLTKKQERKKANYLRSTISFAGLLRHEGRALTKADEGYTCPCPCCFDTASNFYIRANDSSAWCMRCDWAGDALDYIMRGGNICLSCALEILGELPSTVYKQHQPKEDRIAIATPCLGTTSTSEALSQEEENSLKERVQGKDVEKFVSGASASDSITEKTDDTIRASAKSLTIQDLSDE